MASTGLSPQEFGDSRRGRAPCWQGDEAGVLGKMGQENSDAPTQEVMLKPQVAQLCKPLVQPALVGLEQRCGASGRGDRLPVGLGRAGAARSDEAALGEQLSPNGSSGAGC